MKSLYLILLISFSAMANSGVDSGGSGGTTVVKPGQSLIINGTYELPTGSDRYNEFLLPQSNDTLSFSLGQSLDWYRGQAIKDQLINEALEPSDSKKKKIIEQHLSDIIEITLKDGSVIKLD